MENIINTIAEFNKVEGPILISGFPNAIKSFNILNAMKSKTITSRDFYVIDSFEKSPWQSAFDFCNEVKNKAKKTGTYYKSTFEHVKLTEEPAIVIIDLPTVEECYKAFVSHFNSSAEKSLLIFTNIRVDEKEILNRVPPGFKKSRLTKLPTKEVVFLKEKSDIDKIKKPIRTRSVLT